MSLEQRINKLDDITKQLALEIKEGNSTNTLKLLEYILDKVNTKAIIVKEDYTILYLNQALEEFFREHNLDITVGMNWWERFYNSQSPLDWCPIKKTIESKKVTKQVLNGELTKKKLEIICIPLLYNGVSGVIAFFWEA